MPLIALGEGVAIGGTNVHPGSGSFGKSRGSSFLAPYSLRPTHFHSRPNSDSREDPLMYLVRALDRVVMIHHWGAVSAAGVVLALLLVAGTCGAASPFVSETVDAVGLVGV